MLIRFKYYIHPIRLNELVCKSELPECRGTGKVRISSIDAVHLSLSLSLVSMVSFLAGIPEGERERERRLQGALDLTYRLSFMAA